jgi:nucleoside-diphosphate-sugar epimerase
MRVLLAGASGAIGMRLIRQLHAAGAEPVANRGELTAVIAVPPESGRVLYPAR